MSEFGEAFEERLKEIEAYLDLLTTLEHAVQDGPPKLGGEAVTTQQQRMLYSSVYLQLYNLVESTATQCVEAVSEAIKNHEIQPKDLISKLRREWVKFCARTHTDLNYENRLEAAIDMCDFLAEMLPISKFKVSTSGGGNWDDKFIEKIAERIGLSLNIDPQVNRLVKQPFKNDQGALTYIKGLRNQLAHGSISFADCGQGTTVSDLQDLKEWTTKYLREVLEHFGAFIEAQGFIQPECRSAGGNP